MNILMIGSDATTAQHRSKLFDKLEQYTWPEHSAFGHSHSLTYVLMRNHEVFSMERGRVHMLARGGSHKVVTFFKTMYAVYTITRTKKFDCISTQDVLYTGALGLVAKILTGKPLIVQIHGDYVDNPLWLKQSPLRRFENIMAHIVLRYADGVRAVSRRIIRDIKKYVTRPHAKIESIPIGTNISVFTPGQPVFPRTPTLLFVGRLIEEKNPLLFCDVITVLLNKYPDMRAVFAGSGDMEHELKVLMADRGIEQRVIFAGHCTPERMVTLYQQSLCYVHTALWEGWGLPMIESLACGCPVITTDSGCAGEAIIDSVHGYIVPATTDAFVSAIERLYANVDIQKNFTHAASANIDMWSTATLTKKFVMFMETVAGVTDTVQ